MGKSNKFDFTNKPSTGIKLGAFIRTQLEKEADKVVKDADKQTTKARKSSISSAASAASSAETQDAVTHTLDIKVPGKQLGDEGAQEVAKGLLNVLRRGTNEAAVLLEDLNLTGNELTTKSLARLAPIIELAKHDLTTLNLSNNAIKVGTTQEAEEWEEFLFAFQDCLKLRRLDLSGNPALGAKGLEILSRVHLLEEPIDPISASGDASVLSLPEGFDTSDQPTPKTAEFGLMDSMAAGKVLKRRCGLRSIPYISLTNIGLTEAGALWLSYVIADHHLPSQLIDALNAAHATTAINAYQQDANSRGVDWDERESTLCKDGLQILKKAEAFRQQTMLADQVTVASSEILGEVGIDAQDAEAEAMTRRSLDRRHSRAARGDRRTSIRSIRSTDGEYETTELEGARKRLQRSVINKHGAESVELWHTALKVFIYSRTAVRVGPLSHSPFEIYTGAPLFDFTKYMSQKRSPIGRPVTPGNRSHNENMRSLTPVKRRGQDENRRPITPLGCANDENKRASGSGRGLSVSSTTQKQGSYAATLTANSGATAGEPELVITEVTNSPTTPKLVFKPHRKGAFSEGGDGQATTHKPTSSHGSDLHAVTKKLDALVVRDDNPQRFVRWQEKHVSSHGASAFRDVDMPSQLPNHLMERIAGFTISERERSLLSEKQFHAAAAWGLNLANVDVEKEWRKEAKSSQIWRLLEGIGCLEYERD
ncbi:hypothetical protein M409DRAFT_63356 [Zasmidium cellare ATCC 36951]|uniref:Leucine rich repeat protein n=1 Tax=Zasmidium cellare ATCC 36951 TaxID=1080233 RepID=A0A6A6CYF8_ZASCE|nr:uncharacterized protein M409DRAFT_63356 [Zasmidium cellare ATCC 36951]KAF2171763.1 hypothetical protein M409DRAFT_63356 [Zasmidium cellare ATCC 36951]